TAETHAKNNSRRRRLMPLKTFRACTLFVIFCLAQEHRLALMTTIVTQGNARPSSVVVIRRGFQGTPPVESDRYAALSSTGTSSKPSCLACHLSFASNLFSLWASLASQMVSSYSTWFLIMV